MLSLLQRYGAIPDETDLSNLVVDGDLPKPWLTKKVAAKLEIRKLYALVQYVQSRGPPSVHSGILWSCLSSSGSKSAFYDRRRLLANQRFRD
ncbi:MAG: hypothetical protein U0936_24800 [Planctomycetaceae bacterium]